MLNSCSQRSCSSSAKPHHAYAASLERTQLDMRLPKRAGEIVNLLNKPGLTKLRSAPATAPQQQPLSHLQRVVPADQPVTES
jgi:hypothetical protein